jgi:hypothetical protein
LSPRLRAAASPRVGHHVATSLASTSPLVHIAGRHAAPHHWRAALHNSNNADYVKLCIERYQWLSRKQREMADRGVPKHKM